MRNAGFTIYGSSTVEQVSFQLRSGDARVIFTDVASLPKVTAARADAPGLEHVVVVDGDGGTTTLGAVEAAAAGAGFDFDAAWRAVQAEDLVTLIFTSGTTGPPKGAQWAHRTVMEQLRSFDAALPLPREGVVSFLAMAHAGGRIASHYVALPYGATITVCPDMKALPTYLGDAHPDVLFAVPRLWEKLQVGIEAIVAGMPDDEQRQACEDAIAVGLRRAKAEDVGDVTGQEVSDDLIREHEQGKAVLS